MRFVEHWAARWWRMWSTRWDAIEYAVLAYFLLNPSEVTKLVTLLPGTWQDIAAFVIPIALFVAKTGAKVTAQPNLEHLK